MALQLSPEPTDAELEARLGPEVCAWMEAYLDTVDPADVPGLMAEPVWPYTPAQRRMLSHVAYLGIDQVRLDYPRRDAVGPDALGRNLV